MSEKCTCGGSQGGGTSVIHQKWCKKFVNIAKLDNFGFTDPTESLKREEKK